MSESRLFAVIGLMAGLFLIGFAVMGYEMLGSRYLNPYFGGGITTWACLISVVLLAMMIGYFAGGFLVDASPNVNLLSVCAFVAGVYIMFVPSLGDITMQAISVSVGDGFWGALLASMAISLVPVALLSACSPFVVRLLLVDLKTGGKTAGLVYSISTLGNVVGTLFTTFVLIPNYGIRAITLAFGLVLVALGIVFFLLRRRVNQGLVHAAVLAFALLAISGSIDTTRADEKPVKLAASYPEGVIWLEGQLYFAEMTRDRVQVWDGKQRRDFWQETGCGPTSISPYREREVIILCHLAAKLVRVNAEGKKLDEFAASTAGERFQDPNDSFADGQGGVFFSDPGFFSARIPASGRVFHIASDGRITKIIDGLHYANGVTYDPSKGHLLVSEHLARKVWTYRLDQKTFAVNGVSLFLDVDKHLAASDRQYAETGPDGIETDATGNTYIAIYGAGRLLVVSADGRVNQVAIETPYVTNIAVSESQVAVAGAFFNDRAPLAGSVEIISRAGFSARMQRSVANAAH